MSWGVLREVFSCVPPLDDEPEPRHLELLRGEDGEPLTVPTRADAQAEADRWQGLFNTSHTAVRLVHDGERYRMDGTEPPSRR